MASKTGNHTLRFTYDNACKGKARHVSQNAARAAIRSDRQRYGEGAMFGISPYRCSFCRAWHLGHNFR